VGKIARVKANGTLMIKGEVIEYPAELEGRRNLFSMKFYSDIDNYDGISTYRYHLTELDSTKRYAVRAWLKEGEELLNITFAIVSGTPNPNKAESVGGSYELILTPRKIGNTYFVPSDDLPIYISYYPPSIDPSLLNRYNISIQQLDSGYISEWTPAPEDLGLDYDNTIQSFKPSLKHEGDLTIKEIIEFPIELVGKRNLFSMKFYRDINNYDGVQGYRYHLTDLDSNKRYAVRAWVKDGETATSNFWITFTVGHPDPNFAPRNGGTYAHIISNGNPMNSQVLPRNNLPVYISYAPQNTDPSILDKYNISIQQLDSGYISEWAPAPEDLGLEYSSDIQYFNMGIKEGRLMVTKLIENAIL